MRFRPALAVALVLAGCAPVGGPARAPDPGLYSQAYGVADPGAVRTLVVLLHADAPDGPVSYPYAAARAFAAAVPESAVVAVLRPGYADAEGHRSPGVRGRAVGDDYTADRIAAVAETVGALRNRYRRARVILLGDSGGAAIAANLAGMHGGLVDGLVLVGCPCMLGEYRAILRKRSPGAAADAPVAGLDPLQTVGGIAPGLRAEILVGARDEVTPPRLSRGYAEALSLRGIDTEFIVLPDKGHDILGDPATTAALQRLARTLGERP